MKAKPHSLADLRDFTTTDTEGRAPGVATNELGRYNRFDVNVHSLIFVLL